MRRTTVWSDINAKLSVFLEDSQVAGTEQEYSQIQRLTCWNWAQRLLAFHTPRQRKLTLIIGSDSRSALLPPDFLETWRIYNADDQRWMRPMPSPEDAAVRYDDDVLDQYWVWGRNLYFENSYVAGSDDLTLYYWCYWPEIEYVMDSDDVVITEDKVITPPWAEVALMHLTAAQCMQPGAIQAARLRQWNIRVDSGTPIQNVRATQAREHLFWWNAILSMVPPVDW